MKKNFGSAVVTKVITMAMATMLVASSPAINTMAEEATTPTVLDSVQTSTNIYPDEITEKTVEDIVNKISENDELNQDQKDLLIDITTDLGTIDNTQNAVVIIDQSKEIVSSDVEAAIDKKVDSAEAAVEKTEKAVDEAKALDTTIESYEKVTDKLLNNDKALVESVEGNTDSEGNQVVETITSAGDILVNVTDSEGNTTEVKVQEFTQQKADEAVAAKDEAQAAMDAFKSNMTASNAAKQREKIDEAIKTAEVAKAEAETAYNAAQSVLLEEIKNYNAYAAKYGYALYEYTDAEGNVTTPSYSEDELAALPELKAELDALNKTQTEINDGLTSLESTNMADKLAEIESAQTLVDSCDAIVDEARGAVEQIVKAEETLVNTMTAKKDELAAQMVVAENRLANAKNDTEKLIFQAQYDVIKAAHELFESTLYDYTTKEHDADDPNNKGIVTIQGRFDYAVDAAGSLADEIDTMVDDANAKLIAANTRYDAAKAEYEALQKEYEEYLANNIINANFESLKLKLTNAEAAVAEAKTNLNVAVEAVNKAKEIKADFEDAVAKMPSGGSSSDNSSSSSSNTSSTTTVDEVAVPLAAIAEEDVPLAAIMDEPSPLADAVPKTGDASAAAGAVGASGLLAMLGALFMNTKKRTLR